MSSTRYAKLGTPLNQNRFASSPKVNDGLRGNLVALRCETITARADREMIWWLQSVSNRPGGIGKVVSDLVVAFPRHTATCELFELNVKPDRELTKSQTLLIRNELPRNHQFQFLLKGEMELPFETEARRAIGLSDTPWRGETSFERKENERRAAAQAAANPDKYAAAAFYGLCREIAGQNLEDDLKRLCLDPQINVEHFRVWYFHDLVGCLHKLHQANASEPSAHTALSRAVWCEMDDAHENGGLYLLHNCSGNGKSFAAEAYCTAHPGRARYAIAPATNTEIDFWRCIAEAIGTADGLSYKCEQIRTRAKQTLLEAGLVLVIDAAQNLFPVSDYRYALPNRMNQILELAEQGVAVVMIADSKLFDTLGFVEARTGWNRNQFVNQLTRVVELPGTLDRKDVELVAEQLLPDGDRAAQRLLAACMIVAPGYLHAGKSAAQRARRIAESSHHPRVNLADMEAAVESSVRPGLDALNAGLKRADAAKDKVRTKARNWRPETPAQVAAKGNRRRNQIVTSSDLKQPAARVDGREPVARDTNFRAFSGHQLTNNRIPQRQETAELAEV